MCYAKPGPRCSAHALASLEKAKKSQDAEKIAAAYEVFDETKKGMQSLRIAIRHAKTPELREELNKRLISAKARYEQKMKDYHAQRGTVASTSISGKAESNIRELFAPNTVVSFENSYWTVAFSSKPTPQNGGGEPKTDIFVRMVNEQNTTKDISISYKTSSAQFLENKLSAARAKAIFGENTQSIISSAAQEARIFDRELLDEDNNRYCLGYRVDIMSTPGNNYAAVELSQEQLLDIYAGSGLGRDKRNAYVPELGQSVKNSGVAQYILLGDKFNSAQDVLDSMVDIKTHVKNNSKVYLAFKSVNYRAETQEWDGNRSLAYSVEWHKNKDGKITGKVSGDLFAHKANSIASSLSSLLS